MRDELLNAFIAQLIENLDGISEALRILQQKYEVNIAEVRESNEFTGNTDGAYSKNEVLKMLMKKTDEGKADRIREVLGFFHADKFSEVDPQDYSKLMEMVSTL